MRTFLLLTLAVAASGCMTMARGHTTSLFVDADQDSAYVFVNDVPAGVTPTALEVRRSRGHRLEVVREGYQPASAVVRREINSGAVAGTLLLSALNGMAGIAVDAQSGALFDLEPDAVRVELVPDSAGVQAAYVAARVHQARQAALGGFAQADPNRRRSAPWFTVQSASGVYVGGGGDETTGGIGLALALGARDEEFTARVSGTLSAGFLFDNSERWEVAGLVGVLTEAADGRIRLGLSMGPGVVGGRTSNACFLFCDGRSSPRERLPTRVGLSVLGEAHAFITPEIGIGIQVPANFRFGDTTAGAMIGLKYEGLL